LEGCPGDAAAIIVGPEFAVLWLPPTPEAQKMQEEALFREGCREPLDVWRCNGRLFLLSGFTIFPVVRLHRVPFRVSIRELPHREAARLFISTRPLLQNNLSPLAVRYLRGVRYQTEKRRGDGKSSIAPGCRRAHGPGPRRTFPRRGGHRPPGRGTGSGGRGHGRGLRR
jgi:hypothetical protein